MRTTAVALILLMASLALAPLASSQTLTQPLCAVPPGASAAEHCAYEKVYVVMGRVLDVNGLPAKGVKVSVSILQSGVTDAQGNPPTEVGFANCKGDFGFSFRGLKSPTEKGTARVTVHDQSDAVIGRQDQALDPFFRRNDVITRLASEWNFACKQQPDPPWNTQISVTGRTINRTDAYDVDGVTYHAEAWTGNIGLVFWDNEGNRHCPPDGRGGCQPIGTDELGNFKYTWTFDNDKTPEGNVQVLLAGGKSFNASINPVTRLAVHHVDVSGQGPPEKGIPMLTPLLVVLAVALAAHASRRIRRD